MRIARPYTNRAGLQQGALLLSPIRPLSARAPRGFVRVCCAMCLRIVPAVVVRENGIRHPLEETGLNHRCGQGVPERAVTRTMCSPVLAPDLGSRRGWWRSRTRTFVSAPACCWKVQVPQSRVSSLLAAIGSSVKSPRGYIFEHTSRVLLFLV